MQMGDVIPLARETTKTTKKREAKSNEVKRGREKVEAERVDRNDEVQLYEYYFPADVLDDRTSSPSSSS